MAKGNNIPQACYGILQQSQPHSGVEEAAEQVCNLGYAIIESRYSSLELQNISKEFNRAREEYEITYGHTKLKSLDESYIIRSPITWGGKAFFQLAFHENLLLTLKKLIPGKFILNQQNGIINPPQQTYNQGAWHRDLPYQHFVSSKPLAVNALFCVDDFTAENGGTFVLPASHKAEAFPSLRYVQNNAVQLEAKAGAFILMDCMIFHAGGFNNSQSLRRAVNHVYSIPFFKQQINIPKNVQAGNLSEEEKDILGFTHMEPNSISDYLSTRKGKQA